MTERRRYRTIDQLLELGELFLLPCIEALGRTDLQSLNDGKRRRIFFERSLGGIACKLTQSLKVRLTHRQIARSQQRLAFVDCSGCLFGDADSSTQEICVSDALQQRRTLKKRNRQRFARHHDV